VWSPDGKKIAFVSYRDENYEIYVMDADGKNQRNLTKNPATDMHPSWSPDGQRIVFRSICAGHQEIYAMDADGSNRERLTEHVALDRSAEWSPAWSPDGRKIAFCSNRDRRGTEIYLMDPDGKNQERVSENRKLSEPAQWSPSWSPDAQQIVFVSHWRGISDICIMDVDGGKPRNLTDSLVEDKSPDWFDPDFAYSVSSTDKLKGTWGWLKQKH
jgi:TolB protein